MLESDTKGSNAASENGNDLMSDELFEDAVRLVMDTGQASSSMLQRKFRIGYTRAARLVDCMEELWYRRSVCWQQTPRINYVAS